VDYVDVESKDEPEVSGTPPPTPTSSSLGLALVKTAARSRNGRGGRNLPGDGTTWSLVSMTMPRMKMKFPDNKEFRFVQSYENLVFLVQSNLAAVAGGCQQTASQITQYLSLSAVFDQYRINSAETWLIPRNPTYNESNTTNRGLLYSVVDYDDSASLANVGAAEAYSNCVVSPSTMGHYRHYVPHIAVAAYGAGVFTSFANSKPLWIDAASGGVLHYGTKYIVSPCDIVGDEVTYDLITRLDVSFRNVR